MTGNGDWLKRARRRAGFKRQADLATAVGVSRSAIANWETERGVPDMANAERLAVVLDKPRAEVLARYGHPIGAGETVTDLPALPVEWLAAIRIEVARGVAEGIAQYQADQKPSSSDDGPPGRRSA